MLLGGSRDLAVSLAILSVAMGASFVADRAPIEAWQRAVVLIISLGLLLATPVWLAGIRWLARAQRRSALDAAADALGIVPAHQHAEELGRRLLAMFPGATGLSVENVMRDELDTLVFDCSLHQPGFPRYWGLRAELSGAICRVQEGGLRVTVIKRRPWSGSLALREGEHERGDLVQMTGQGDGARHQTEGLRRWLDHEIPGTDWRFDLRRRDAVCLTSPRGPHEIALVVDMLDSFIDHFAVVGSARDEASADLRRQDEITVDALVSDGARHDAVRAVFAGIGIPVDARRWSVLVGVGAGYALVLAIFLTVAYPSWLQERPVAPLYLLGGGLGLAAISLRRDRHPLVGTALGLGTAAIAVAVWGDDLAYLLVGPALRLACAFGSCI